MDRFVCKLIVWYQNVSLIFFNLHVPISQPKPILPVLPNLNSTYEVNSAAAATAAALNSTYNAGAAAKALNSTYNAGAKAADATFEVAEHDASSYDMTPKRLPT